MELKVICMTARSATLETEAGRIFEFDTEGEIYINGSLYKRTNRVIFSLFGLRPDTEYEVCLKRDGEEARTVFRTDYEFVTLNVKEVGAKGDGIQDDTGFIQAAILACPKNGRVLIPKGVYRITSLFLKSHIRLELAAGAVLAADTDRFRYPRFPGMIESCDETEDYNLGTWEGNPLPMFAGIINGIEVEDVVIYGEGLVDGQASFENWWNDVGTMRGAFRPRMVFLERCKSITLQGFHLKNSPTWVLHPYFSQGLRFLDLDIRNPADSPNTDGLDPESCRDVEIAGLHFSLGDDCIAIKSGKIYMGRRYKTPSENIEIRQCLMENGHGAVTVGSEVGAGVKAVQVKDCLFRCTDRGLRVKTRRGRGRDSVLSDISFQHIIMENVMTPFVVNSFYFCDPDGKTEYVGSRKPLPVDDRTPSIKSLTFKDINAKNCHVAGAYIFGLPESKVEKLTFENINFSYAKDAKPGVAAMMLGCDEASRQGLIVSNVEKLILKNVNIEGCDGEAIVADNVDKIERD